MSEGHDDFDFEPVRGLPKALPAGETILWQGAPDWHTLARRGFHVRKLAAYFGVLLAWVLANSFANGSTPAEAALAFGQLAGLSAVAIGLVLAFAWGVGRSTVYTITQRRLVMRFGMALPITFNIPFKVIEKAGLRLNPDGSGDIVMTLAPGERLAYIVMWPHVRPWRISRVEPALRAIRGVEAVAQILARAVVAESAAAGRVPAVRGIVDEAPAGAGVGSGGRLSGSPA